MEVKAWQELIKIPTYKTGPPNRNPMFLEKRVYQGSSGVVYPHPVIDKVYDEKEDKEWTALYLENEYLKVMILPELGGRIQMAYDKTNDYHFVYYNRVIKPALVGLTGPWISGGIEFNWPQHHRPSTFESTDFMIRENDDGSKTVWVNEYEIMFRTKCSLGFTLYPGKAYIELHAKLHNRTPFPQSFLWWANPAVAVDEHYQTVFPPDVDAVYDHGKRDVSSFPIATGTYYKVDYSPGTDISIYTNIPVPTSYMAVNSEFNFVGGYHHKKKAGMIHVADHHISPGKKQWTWGCGEFGKAWDRQLTDEDGPYFELMCGVYTDNQPDFSWIMPNEVRAFKQYFMPYKNIGYVKNASIDAMVNFEIDGDSAALKVYVTCQRTVKILLKKKGSIIHDKTTSLSPVITYEETILLDQPVMSPGDYCVEVLDDKGHVLISYLPVNKEKAEVPEVAKAIPEPAELKTNEELYLAGLHLEQYRHATYHAEDYYAEAIKRDPTDTRSNNALGLLYLRRGEYQRSEDYFRAAIAKLNRHNPNPYDSEPLYNLGLALKFQERNDEAYSLFYKSTWTAHFRDNAYLQLAYIEANRRNWEQALLFIEESLSTNARSPKARHLKTIIGRKLGKPGETEKWALESLESDPFNFGARYELYKVFSETGRKERATEILDDLKQLMRGWDHNYIETAIDYASAGLHTDAFDLLYMIADTDSNPLTFYYLGYYKYRSGEAAEAKRWLEKGFQCSPDRVFPNRLEDIAVLKKAIEINSNDHKACYYLGNFYYARHRFEDAKKTWERSIKINDRFPTVLRNLGIALYNKFDKKDDALLLFEKAFSADPTDSRVIYELDQLNKRFHKRPEERLLFLEKYESLISERDDLYIEYVLLHTLTGKFHQAKRLLENRNFHPWEGGEGKASGQHIQIHVELAKNALRDSQFKEALELLHIAQTYPENLGEGKLYGALENDIHYWMGCVYEQLNEINLMSEFLHKASVGPGDPLQAIYYNDQQPDKIFYQGLALLKLGNKKEAVKRFNDLIRFGELNMNKEVKIDYFAVSLPDLMIFNDDLGVRNNVHCHYLLGLGWLGLEQYDRSEDHFREALCLDPAHPGVIIHRAMLNEKTKSIPREK